MYKLCNDLTSWGLALGIVVGSFILGNGISHIKDSERIVSVKGLSEREVMADKVVWPLVYKEVGNNLQTLYSSLEKKNDIIISFLISNGISEEDIEISSTNIIDLKADRYNNQKVEYRYNVTQVITVSSNNIRLVKNLKSKQSDLLKKGIVIISDDYQYNTRYLYTSDALNTIKPDMIAEATRNARLAGEKFADDSDSKLGKIKVAHQGQFSISDRDYNTSSIKIVRVVTSVEYFLKD